MSLRLSCFLSAGLLVLLAPHCPAQRGRDARAARREIEAAYAKVSEAYRNKDINAFMADKTEDFTGKMLNGSVSTREQVEAAVKQRMERIGRLNYLRVRIRKLTVRGDTAEAITTQEFSRVVADAQGNERTVVSKGTTHRDTWVRVGGAWKMKSVEELKQGRELIDGRPSAPRR